MTFRLPNQLIPLLFFRLHQSRVSCEVDARRRSPRRQTRKRKMAKRTAPRRRRNPMRKWAFFIWIIVKILFSVVTRKMIRCRRYRVDRWSRKLHLVSRRRLTPPSQRQRWPHRQLPETLCQRRRPRLTRMSTPSSRRWTHGKKMDRRKVSFWLAFLQAQLSVQLKHFQTISTRVPTAKVRMKSNVRFMWKSSRWTMERRPSPHRSMSFERLSRISRYRRSAHFR